MSVVLGAVESGEASRTRVESGVQDGAVGGKLEWSHASRGGEGAYTLSFCDKLATVGRLRVRVKIP